MRVWIVTRDVGAWEWNERIEGVFDTKEKAEQFQKDEGLADHNSEIVDWEVE